MSTVERIERVEERRRRRAFLLLATLTIVALGLVGRSWYIDPVDGGTDVLSEVQERFGLQAIITQRPQASSGTGNAVIATDGWETGGPTTNAGGGEGSTPTDPAAASPTSAPSSTGGRSEPGRDAAQGEPGTAGGGSGSRGVADDRSGGPGRGSGGRPGRGVADPAVGAGGRPGTDAPAAPQAFGISGDLADLYPGFVGDLDLTLTNPHRFRIVVTDLAVQVGTPTLNGAPVPACVGLLTVDPWQGARRVATLDTTSQRVATRFSADAPDACQNVAYPLSYGGTAIREDRP